MNTILSNYLSNLDSDKTLDRIETVSYTHQYDDELEQRFWRNYYEQKFMYESEEQRSN